MKLTEYSVKNRVGITAISIALIVLGIYGLLNLAVDFLPGITYPMIKVHIWWRGATPEEIDKNIADPIEQQMATVDDLDYLESSSIEGMYTLLVNFKYGVDVNVAYQDCLAAMARAARQLPPDIDAPIIIKADPSQLPVAQITVSSDSLDLVKLRTWTDEWLNDQMLSVPGVAGTEVVGGLKREIRIHLDPLALEKYSLSLDGLSKRLADENVDMFAGRVTVSSKEIIARTTGEFKNVKEIGGIIVADDGVSKVRLDEIARIEDAHEETRVITKLNGKPCVKLSVLKQSTANTVAVSDAVNKRLEELRQIIPDSIKLGMVENQAEYVRAALNGVRNSAIESAILLILIVYIFLGSWRQVFIMIILLPVIVIVNFCIMKLAGFSLNIFSLGGLVIAIGVLLDNSTVAIESITLRQTLNPGEDPSASANNAISQVGPALIAGTLSFLALFLPFLIVPGLTSLLFRELILVIAGIVLVSLLAAITVNPMLCSIFLLKQSGQDKKTRFQIIFRGVTEFYGKILAFTLRYKWVSFAFFILILACAYKTVEKIGSEFLPEMDDGRILVKVKLPTGGSVGETEKILNSIQKSLDDDPLVESSFILAGGKVWGLYTYEIANEGEIDIQLVPKKIRKISTAEYINRIRPEIMKLQPPGAKIILRQMPLKGIRKLGESDIEVKIKGQDVGKLFELAQSTSMTMNKLDVFQNVYISLDMSKPEYQVEIDRTKAAELGVSVADLAKIMRSLVTGTVASRYREGNEYYNIRMMIPEAEMNSKASLENLVLMSSKNAYLRLKDVAMVRTAVGPVEIVREDQIKQVVVRSDAAGVSVGEALEKLKNEFKAMKWPPGYEYSFGGKAQMLSDMKKNVFAVLSFAIFFAFIVLAIQFNSFKLPFALLAAVPFCVAGLVFALKLSEIPFGATVIIGVLVIAAAAISDGVLLITFAEELKKNEGLSPFDAVIKSAKLRFRPRIMTTMTTLAAFIPLALAIEEGGDMLRPMAVAAVGGLLMEIPVALLLMPCLYLITYSTRKPENKAA